MGSLPAAGTSGKIKTRSKVADRQAADKPRWLSAYRELGGVIAACEATGVAKSNIYRWRNEDDDFRLKWDQADEAVTESLEKEARRRATNGSDVLLIFLLKAHRPTVYRENIRAELSGPDGGPIQYVEGFNDHERARLREVIDQVTEGITVAEPEPVS